ncbi:hypothetical protein HUJ05_000226 [Dendroctonus ponderosae]|nr:hypothetical protein HUJ05_000226 [Dendroctonus ponderosae]
MENISVWVSGWNNEIIWLINFIQLIGGSHRDGLMSSNQPVYNHSDVPNDVYRIIPYITRTVPKVNFIQLIGGSHKGEAVGRALRQIITTEVAVLYSFKGKKGEKSFQKLFICKRLIDGLLKNPLFIAARKYIEIEIQNSLRHAPERLKRDKNSN